LKKVKDYNNYWIFGMLGVCQTTTIGVSRDSIIIFSHTLNNDIKLPEHVERFGDIPLMNPKEIKELLKTMEREKLIFSFISKDKKRVYKIAHSGQKILYNNDMLGDDIEKLIQYLTEKMDAIQEGNPKVQGQAVKYINKKWWNN
jgi:hypothetical protein